ncbi:MAG: hypothetical protein GY920_20195 [Aliivibrio sp.]|nr:hypothetical protein [Aliivibrio sp.]MCP4322143.1 hypothetical protein [Alteromonadales bacterium]
MNIGTTTYFIISAFRGNNLKADVVYTNELEDVLKDRNEAYKRAEGRYNGIMKEVFIVEAPSHLSSNYKSRDLAKSTLLELAEVFEQDHIMEIDVNNNLLYLHYTVDGNQEYIGKVRTQEQEPQGDYTRIRNSYITLLDS